MTKFDKVVQKHFKTLEQYVPIVDRVHGKTHPEFNDVHEIFNQISKKLEVADALKPQLSEQFEKLRKVTDNYTIPGDVCESYEAVYNMLSELDRAYHSG